uniref:Uncharacterized protein n=1 Tax=Pithovirus LCPAC403 TaxID=2506596 RepID=A0A481ZAT2_9VIRU|nr:MAG: uncharacterized protein LCPAC403_01620 [Pithovirus LCPAC403]
MSTTQESISEEKLDVPELNESKQRLFIINKISLVTDPKNWPIDSMPRLMYEGDKDASEYVINNSKINRESIELIRSVVLKDTEGPMLYLIDIDWDNIELTIRYLGIGVGVDFLYPLFLVPDDRVMWYDECEARISHTCQYRPEDDGDLFNMDLDDVLATDPPYTTLNNLNLHPKELEMMRQPEEKEEITDRDRDMSDLIDEIVQTLSSVPDLLIVRDVALARFRGIKYLTEKIHKRQHGRKVRSQTIQHVTNMDVFAYGQGALERIIESVKLCLELSKKNFREFYHIYTEEFPNLIESDTEEITDLIESKEITFMDVKERLTPSRTRHRIKVPVMSKTGGRSVILDVVFPLVRLHSKHDILTKIPLDCFSIGFDPKDPNMFYGLSRTYRSLDTMTNVVDPTRNGIKYLRTLNAVSRMGFDIAIPGFNIDDIDTLFCSDKIFKILNFARFVRLFEKQRKYIRRSIRPCISVEQQLDHMKLSGLVLLLTQIIHINVSTYHHNRYSDSEIAMEHSRVTTHSLIRSIYEDPHRSEVIFGDVLNQDGQEFRITATRKYKENYITENLTYIPLFPKIELLNFESPTILHQVKTAFYGQYTCIEEIDIPDDVGPAGVDLFAFVNQESEYSDIYELLKVLSQRTL